ncbi:hypothetical protein BDQ17DRAFT_1172644, partial [Cyathus striatus]
MALPKDIPTLCAMGTSNFMHVDQIFLDEDLLEDLIICSTAPALRPPKMDHFLIITSLIVDTPKSTQQPQHNFKKVNWGEFQDALAARLLLLPVPQEFMDMDNLKVSLQRL